MSQIQERLSENKVPLVIAIIQWFVTTILQVDRTFFTYDSETTFFFIIKCLFLLLLMVAWCFVFMVYRKIKAQDANYKRGVQVFLVYFSIMMVLLLILWPGTWSWDDLWTLHDIQHYDDLNEWQHIITGIYHDLMLQILPFPGGVIFLQNVLVSICVAFTVTKLENTFHIRKLKNTIPDILLKIVPFLLPPVLMYQFSGYRMGLYVYFELVMLVIFIVAERENKEWTWSYTLLFCFLVVIVATWRTESFLYIPFACILLFMMNKNILSTKRKCICVLIVIVGFLGINKWQNYELGDSNYQIISLLRPCAELVRVADYEDNVEEFAAIDKVTDLEVIFNNPTMNGETLYWSTGCVRTRNDNPDDDYTKEDYHNYLKAFIKLSLKYPKVVIAERWNLFIGGSGIYGSSPMIINYSANLFEENGGNEVATEMLSSERNINRPVLKNIRRAVINIFGGKKIDGTDIGIVQRLMWNAIIPMLFLVYAWIELLIRKKWYLWLVCSSLVAKIPIIILTQPSAWLMYLLSFYFLGYVFIIYKGLLVEAKEMREY
ncbi:MAG: hypothetical protein J6A11_03585 [Lachnospiraceae bacterium]|nr:hypothetical protein [Lachnospiraceae bacterium]